MHTRSRAEPGRLQCRSRGTCLGYTKLAGLYREGVAALSGLLSGLLRGWGRHHRSLSGRRLLLGGRRLLLGHRRQLHLDVLCGGDTGRQEGQG